MRKIITLSFTSAKWFFLKCRSHVLLFCVHCLPSEEDKHESVLILFVTLSKIVFFINTLSQVEYICELSSSTTVGLADRDYIRLVWCKPCNFHQHVWCLYCACVIKSVCNHLRFQLRAGRLTVSEHKDCTSPRNSIFPPHPSAWTLSGNFLLNIHHKTSSHQ